MLNLEMRVGGCFLVSWQRFSSFAFAADRPDSEEPARMTSGRRTLPHELDGLQTSMDSVNPHRITLLG